MSPFIFFVVVVGRLEPFGARWNHGFSATSFACTCAVALLIIVRHKENIRRLASGTENKLGAKKA